MVPTSLSPTTRVHVHNVRLGRKLQYHLLSHPHRCTVGTLSNSVGLAVAKPQVCKTRWRPTITLPNTGQSPTPGQAVIPKQQRRILPFLLPLHLLSSLLVWPQTAIKTGDEHHREDTVAPATVASHITSGSIWLTNQRTSVSGPLPLLGCWCLASHRVWISSAWGNPHLFIAATILNIDVATQWALHTHYSVYHTCMDCYSFPTHAWPTKTEGLSDSISVCTAPKFTDHSQSSNRKTTLWFPPRIKANIA
jgi:hypothetical protein